MAKLDIEQIELTELVGVIRSQEPSLEGAVSGRSTMRDIVASHLACSMLEAEELVDTLVVQGLARLERDRDGREGWRLAEPEWASDRMRNR